MGDEEQYCICWVCGSLVRKSRIEKHHINGRKREEDLEYHFPLCILCHDLVDRMALDDIEVFSEFIGNTIREFDELRITEPGKFKWIKLTILKFNKIYLSSLLKKPIKDDNNQIDLQKDNLKDDDKYMNNDIIINQNVKYN